MLRLLNEKFIDRSRKTWWSSGKQTCPAYKYHTDGMRIGDVGKLLVFDDVLSINKYI
jgi:hypothetical protein